MKKIICRIFGCDWRYNFPSIPNKCICKRCHSKAKLNLTTLEWEEIPYFGGDLGTDEEMVNRWFKL